MADLEITINADTQEAIDKFRSFNRTVDEFKDSIGRLSNVDPFKKITQNAGLLGKTWGATKTALAAKIPVSVMGAGLAISGLVGNQIKKTSDQAHAIENGSEKLGVTSDAFQKIAYAANMTDVEMGKVEGAFKKIASLQIDGKGAETFAKYGIAFSELQGLSPDQQFARITDAVASIADPTVRAQAAIELLGKSGMDILPLAGKIGELGTELESMGGIMTDETIASVAQLEDAMKKLDTTFMAIVANSGIIQMAADLTAQFQDLATAGHKLKQMGGSSTVAGYEDRGFFQNWMQNTSDYWFGESEGRKVDTLGTTEWDVKEANKKKAEKDRINEAGRKAKAEADIRKQFGEENDRLLKEGDAVLKQSDDTMRSMAESSAKELAAEEERKLRAQIEYLDNLDAEGRKQELTNAGKLRELYIEEELAKARKAGIENERELSNVAGLAGQTYDLKNKSKQEAYKLPEYSDSLLRIGGTIGKGAVGNDGPTLQRKTNDLVTTLIKTVQEQTAKWDKYAMREAGND